MYKAKNYSHLLGLVGFSDQALKTHFSLYEGYVNNTNQMLDEIDELNKNNQADSIHYAEIKRRLGWEFDGMRLHEYYFENLGGMGEIDKEGKLFLVIEKSFGNFSNWQEDFFSTGKIRGIGWVILYQDTKNGKLFNFWISEHNGNHPVGLNPLLVMDVFEHAYFIDYGKDRNIYLEAFRKNINWEEVEKRLLYKIELEMKEKINPKV